MPPKNEVKRFKNKYKNRQRNQWEKVHVLELLDLAGAAKLLRRCLFYEFNTRCNGKQLGDKYYSTLIFVDAKY